MSASAAEILGRLPGPRYAWRTVRRFAWPEKAASVVEPEDQGLVAEDFDVLTEDGLTIRGWVFAPASPHGVVIACHGRGANKGRIMAPIAMLFRRGFAVVAFDFRACGASDAPGRRWYNGMWEPLRDLEAVARYVEGRFPGARVALLGYSFGGNMAIAHAGTTGRTYAALVLDSTPLIRWRSMLSPLLGEERAADPMRHVRAAWDALAISLVVRLTRADELYRHARRSARSLHETPLLLVVGERDRLFDVDESVRFVQRHYAGAFRIWRVPRGRHLTNHIVSERAYEDTLVSFLTSAMQKGLQS